jgi:NADH-quinone oxidoreductase subunit N
VVFDGAFIVDDFARFMKLLVLGGAVLVMIMSFANLERQGLLSFEYSVLFLLAVVGMMLMISAGDLIALYLGVELQSLSLYVVAALKRDQVRSSEAGLKYFVLGALSSGMLLYGASLIYGFTGSVDFGVIASVSQGDSAAGNIGLTVGLVFLLVGIAFKISAVPFHMWTPDVYQGAPTPVTAFFAAAPKLAAMALLMRVVFTAFPGIAPQWQQIIIFLSIASMLLGAFAAIGQSNIKRLMAYSSIGHIGYALVGVAANNEVGMQAVLIYLSIYLFMTLGAFACILSMRTKNGMLEEIDSLAGLAKTNLPLAFVLAMILFSMAGIPPLAGFFAKFYVFSAAIKADLLPLAIVGVLSSVVAAYYYLRVIKVMFFDDATQSLLPVERGTGFVMTIAALFVLLFVLVPQPLVNAALVAAQSLQTVSAP